MKEIFRKAQEELRQAELRVGLAEENRKRMEYELHLLIWAELQERSLVPPGRFLGDDLDTRLYTDRKTECETSPIGTCVEIGWHDECVFCKSARYDYQYPSEEEDPFADNQ